MKSLWMCIFLLSLYTTSLAKSDSLVQMVGIHYALKMSYRNIATSNSDLKNTINDHSGYKFADDIGLFYLVILPSKIGLRVGMKYANKGFNINDYDDFGFKALPNEKYKVGFHSISIPVQISYHKIDNGKKYHFYPFLEVSYDILISTSKKSSGLPKESINSSNPLYDDYRKHNLSAAFGMGWLYKINPAWVMGFRAYFTTDILPVYGKNGWDTRLDASAVSLEINYVFGNTKLKK